MSILDGILGQISQNVDVANLAAKVGLSPEHVEQAVHALAKFHPMDVDTAEGAASATGLPVEKLREIITHIGGEGSLGHFANLLNTDAAGVMGQIGGLFGQK